MSIVKQEYSELNTEPELSNEGIAVVDFPWHVYGLSLGLSPSMITSQNLAEL